MLPLQRSRAPQSIHSWWSDSNPGGPAFPLHRLAKPLSKFLHHRAVSSIIAKSRSGPLSKGNLEALTWYLQSRNKEIKPSTKVLILQELNRRALWEAQTQLMVEENVHHAIVQLLAELLGSANNNMLARACTLLGTLAQWRSGNVAIVDANPCHHLVWLVTYNDSPAVHKQAVYALTRLGQYSAAGARALIKAGAVSLTSTLLRSEDSDILEWTSRMAVDLSHSSGFSNNMSEVHSERTTRRTTTNNPESSRDRARLNLAVDDTYRYCPEIQECDSTPSQSLAMGSPLGAQVVHREDIIEPFTLRTEDIIEPSTLRTKSAPTLHTASNYQHFHAAALVQDHNTAERPRRERLNPPAYSPYVAPRTDPIPLPQSPASAMPKKMRSTKKARAANEMAPADHKLILMIPCAEQGTQRQQLTHATTFSEALDIIHETIGCADVDKKPALMYKLSTAGKQDEAIRLGSDADWAGCREEVTNAEKDKKKAISVKIIVTEQYLHSLRVKLAVKATDPKATGKQKMQLLHLDHAQSGDDDFDDGLDITEKEKRYLEQLKSQYGKCQLCGPTKICQTTIAGAHYDLGNNSMAQHMAMNLVDPFGLMPLAMPTIPPSFHDNSAPIMPPLAPLASWTTGSKLSPAFPSSDPSDMAALNPYPEISYFLNKLDELQPRRQLRQWIPKFEELDFYNIDELMKLGPAAMLAHITSISLGNATYILEKAKGEIKRVNREIKSKA